MNQLAEQVAVFLSDGLLQSAKQVIDGRVAAERLTVHGFGQERAVHPAAPFGRFDGQPERPARHGLPLVEDGDVRRVGRQPGDDGRVGVGLAAHVQHVVGGDEGHPVDRVGIAITDRSGCRHWGSRGWDRCDGGEVGRDGRRRERLRGRRQGRWGDHGQFSGDGRWRYVRRERRRGNHQILRLSPAGNQEHQGHKRHQDPPKMRINRPVMLFHLHSTV